VKEKTQGERSGAGEGMSRRGVLPLKNERARPFLRAKWDDRTARPGRERKNPKREESRHAPHSPLIARERTK